MTRRVERGQLVGLALFLLGVLLNEWTLTILFSPDGVIMRVKRYLIRAFDVGCIAIGLALLATRRPAVWRGKAVLLAILVVVFSGLLLEGGLRLYFHLRARAFRQGRAVEEFFGWRTNPNYRSVRELPGYGLVTYSTTTEGFRVWGNISTAKQKVLVLGDSTTEAAQVSDGQTYYDYLRQHCSDTEVFAYGAGGYGSLQEYLILDAYWDKIRPDMVVWQFDGNDIMNNSLALESVSDGNIMMFRPYLLDGRIELRYPARSRSPVLRALESSYLVRLLHVMPYLARGEHQAHRDVDRLAEREQLFAEAAAITREVMRKVKTRIGNAPLVAFCIYEGQDRASGRVYEAICGELGFHYVRGVDEAIAQAKASGKTVTGMVSGREVDTHLNAEGHAILGRVLLDYLTEHQLLRCAP